MVINGLETRLNIIEKHGSLDAYAKMCGISRRQLDYVIAQGRGNSRRASAGLLVLRRLRAEGLLVEENDADGPDGDQAANG